MGKLAKLAALPDSTHTKEVAMDMPITIVSACEELFVADQVQNILMNTCMRSYTNVDIRGVELCGTLKDTIALTAGGQRGLPMVNIKATSGNKLADRYIMEMPIVSAVNAVINHNIAPKETVRGLMERGIKAELSNSTLDINFENVILRNKRGVGMKRVITYGTFDLLHYGHINLLRRAKALGDYLIVVISSDEFNWNEKHKKCYFTYEQRKALVEAVRYVDLVIPETCWEQKKTDIHEYHIDTFVMGDDWDGKFDFLKDEGCKVVYLPRTPEISTSQIKHDMHE